MKIRMPMIRELIKLTNYVDPITGIDFIGMSMHVYRLNGTVDIKIRLFKNKRKRFLCKVICTKLGVVISHKTMYIDVQHRKELLQAVDDHDISLLADFLKVVFNIHLEV